MFYTTQNGLQNQILLSIKVEAVDFLTTIYIAKNEAGEYSINAYLPTELYDKVKFKLLLVNKKCDTTPYFEAMCQAIQSTEPVPSNHASDLAKKRLYRFMNDEYNPYFETIIRKKMSKDMKEKVLRLYGHTLAKQIFQFCGTTKTLRFTSDIAKSKDIWTFLEEALIK